MTKMTRTCVLCSVATVLLLTLGAATARCPHHKTNPVDEFDHPFFHSDYFNNRFHEEAADDLATQVQDLQQQLNTLTAENARLRQQSTRHTDQIRKSCFKRRTTEENIKSLMAKQINAGEESSSSSQRRQHRCSLHQSGSSWGLKSMVGHGFFWTGVVVIGLLKSLMAFAFCAGFQTNVFCNGARAIRQNLYQAACHVRRWGRSIASSSCTISVFHVLKCITKMIIGTCLFCSGISVAISCLFFCPCLFFFLVGLFLWDSCRRKRCAPSPCMATRVEVVRLSSNNNGTDDDNSSNNNSPPTPESDSDLHSLEPQMVVLTDALLRMGYTRDRAVSALEATRNIGLFGTHVYSLERALDRLAEVVPEGEVSEVPKEADVTAAIDDVTVSNTASPLPPVIYEATPATTEDEPSTAHPEAAVAAGATEQSPVSDEKGGSDDWDQMLIELQEMGFEGPGVLEAAKEAEGDMKKAVKLMVQKEREAATQPKSNP